MKSNAVITKKYPNGFRIAYEPSNSSVPITSLYLLCDVGPVYEYDKMRGASHFIEHMCFKGSKKIPQSKDIFHEYAKIGAQFNAYTTKRYTCYTVQCQDDYIHHSLDILADMLMNSLFNASEFKKEEKIVIEENNNNENKPDIVINNAMERMIYAGSSYEFPIDCLDYHTKRSLQYKDVVEFYKRYYEPSNMILSVVSNLPFRDIERFTKPFIKEKSDNRKLYSAAFRVIQHCLSPQRDIQYQLIKKRGITNVHINIAFRTCGRNNDDKYALMVLEKIMGDGLNGRLMMILREAAGLVYGASATTDFFEESGGFLFSTVTNSANMSRVLPLLITVIRDMIKKGVTKAELATFKGNTKGNMLIESQDITAQTRYIGEEMIFSQSDDIRIIPYRNVFGTFIAPLTLTDVRRVIQRYFTKENMCVSILSEDLPSLETLKRECDKIV